MKIPKWMKAFLINYVFFIVITVAMAPLLGESITWGYLGKWALIGLTTVAPLTWLFKGKKSS